MLARSENLLHLSALRQSWCSWNRSVLRKKYTWPFPIHTSIVPALWKACWGLDPARLPFSAQNQGSLTAFHLKSSRKLIPQTQILCQFRDRYSILCWFWMWNQHWSDHGNWVAALNLERHSALLNAFKCSQSFGWKMLTPVLPLVTWQNGGKNATTVSRGPNPRANPC